MSIRITFIVPCYNVEQFVGECLDSIFSCPLSSDEYEVICIDDCSPDHTAEILKAYQEKYANMRIVTHPVNRGLGGARNSGIREARGQYLWFIDSDDFIETDCLCEMLQMAAEGQLDVLAFNYRETDSKRTPTKECPVFSRSEVLSGLLFVRDVFGDDFPNHAGYVWRFLYRTDYLRERNLFFPEQVYWEDTVYMPKSILSAERIQAVPFICYDYRRNESSVSGQFHRRYSAELICQMAFGAGGDLLAYAGEIEDEALSHSFRRKAISMINGFWLHLIRTDKACRNEFYHRFPSYDVPREVLSHKNRVLMTPVIGRWMAEVLATVYRMKHRY